MLGRTNTGGGGSGGLNFQVIGGTTAPSNPKENMIWVNTSTKITSYIFSATQPTGSAGMVWISTGTSSTVEFNALKKNGIQVYPISAKQYINGAWRNVEAKSYRNGSWVEWLETEKFLYYRGNFYNGQSLSEQYNQGCTYTFEDDRIDIYAGSYTGNAVYLYFDPISLAGKTKLIVRANSNGNFSTTGGSDWMCGFAVYASKTNNPNWGDPHANRLKLSAGEEVELSLDISRINDTRYIVIRASCSGGSGILDVDIYEVEVS